MAIKNTLELQFHYIANLINLSITCSSMVHTVERKTICSILHNNIFLCEDQDISSVSIFL